MTNAIVLVGWSLAVAMALTLGVWLLCRTNWLRQRPALCHLLWLLVLVKLVVPSFVSVAVLPGQTAPEASAVQIAPVALALTNESKSLASTDGDFTTAKPDMPRPPSSIGGASPTFAATPGFPDPTGHAWLWGLLAISAGVSCLLGLFALLQCREVYRMVRGSMPDSGRAAALLREVAGSFQVRKPPSVIVVDTNVTPMLWGAPRQSVVILPRPLVEVLDDDEVRSILAHELAHFVRRDPWSNTFAFCVTMLVWWNPMAWVARRQLTAAAELSCDAMVVERLCGSRKRYAQTLLRVVDFLADRKPRRLAVAVTFGESRSLRRRFEMLADARITSKVSRFGWGLLLLGAATSMLMPARAEQPATNPIAPAPAVAIAPFDNAKAAGAADPSEPKPDPAAPVPKTAEPALVDKKPGQPIKGFGIVFDPDGDCQFNEEKDGVTIVVPKTWHDLTYTEDYSKLNAPRILQDTKGDFSLEDKVEVFELPKGKAPSGGAYSFVSSGLLIWQDDRNFIRLERAAMDDSLFIWVERFQDGKSAPQGHHEIANRDVYLRATRKGDTFTFEMSEDGKKWVRIHSEETKLAERLKVGVLAINTTTDEFAVKLKDLKLTAQDTAVLSNEQSATVAGVAGETGIYVIKTDGTEARKVVSVDGYAFHGSPRWSHDGKRLAFDAVTPNERTRRFFVVNADGSGLQELGAEAMPDWAPNDERLVFQDHGSIWIQDGAGRKRLIAGACPRWSPDGSRIIFTDRRTIKVLNLADGKEQEIVDISFDEFPHGFDWSRDGKQIAFVARRTGAQVRELFIVDMDRLPAKPRVRYAHDGGLAKHVNWSPDGKQLAIAIDAFIHVLDVEGTSAPRLLPGQNAKSRDPVWSPDGKWFTFARRPR